MFEIMEFMLDGSLLKAIISILILLTIASIVRSVCDMIAKIFHREDRNFFICEKNIDEKFVKQIKEATNKKE